MHPRKPTRPHADGREPGRGPRVRGLHGALAFASAALLAFAACNPSDFDHLSKGERAGAPASDAAVGSGGVGGRGGGAADAPSTGGSPDGGGGPVAMDAGGRGAHDAGEAGVVAPADGGALDADPMMQPDGGGAGMQDAQPPDSSVPCATQTCGDECVDLRSDARHCSACNAACATGYACIDSRCGNALVDVHTGINSSYARLHNGEIWAWGSNQLGQLGEGSTAGVLCIGSETGGVFSSGSCRAEPGPVLSAPGVRLRDVVQMSASFFHVCVVTRQGEVWCWGRNEFGELGHARGASGDRNCEMYGGAQTTCNPVPARVAGLAGVAIAEVGCGGDYTCVRSQAGEVRCWGRNDDGELGIAVNDPALDPATRSTSVPQTVPLPAMAKQLRVASQSETSCVLLASGSVSCFGAIERTAGVDRAARGTGFTTLSAGRWAACGVAAQRVSCWGLNGLGVLGRDPATMVSATTPQSVPVLPASIDELAGSDATLFAVASDGRIWGWGRNNYGTVGDGTLGGNGCGAQSCVFTPTAIANLRVQRLSAAGTTTLALDRDGALWAWGMNSYGQLGHAPGTANDLPCGAGSGRTNEVCDPVPRRVAWPQ